MAETFLLGILLEVLSGISGTLGKQLISLSARKVKRSHARALFVLGLLLSTVLGATLDATAYGFAAESVVAPFNGVQILLNILLAPCILDERVTVPHVIGTLLVATGASLTAVFGSHKSAPASLEDVQEKLFRWNVLFYGLAFCAALGVCAGIMWWRPKGVGDKVRGIALGVSAGSIAGNMCFVKCAMGLLMLGFEDGDWSAWTHWLPYVLVALAIFVALGNVPLMVTGLREYEAVFMVTLFGGSQIIMACVSGDVVLLEMQQESMSKQLAYWASVFVIILGLLIINTTAVHGVNSSKSSEQDAIRSMSGLSLHEFLEDGLEENSTPVIANRSLC